MSDLIDITGQRFGLLTALKRVDRSRRYRSGATWLCRCDCGNLTEVSGFYLRRGRTRSCGCAIYHKRPNRRGPLKTGERFGHWTVISDVAAYPGVSHDPYRYVQCDCGKIKLVPTSNLTNGASRSCGCGVLQTHPS